MPQDDEEQTLSVLLAGLVRAEEAIRSLLTALVPTGSPRRQLAVGTLARTADALKAIASLASQGLGLEAGAVARVIVEAAYRLAWASHSELRAQALLDDADRDFVLLIKRWRDLGVPTTPPRTERVASAEARLIEQYGTGAMQKRFDLAQPGSGPWIPNGRDMAKTVPLDHPHEFYDLHYKSLCRFGHPTVDSLLGAVGGAGPGLAPGVCVHAAVALAVILDCAGEMLGMRAEFTAISNKLVKDTTGSE